MKIKITRQECNALIAEKVRGWTRNGVIPFWNDADGNKTPHQNSPRYKHANYWNPTTDANHALEALEKWCDLPTAGDPPIPPWEAILATIGCIMEIEDCTFAVAVCLWLLKQRAGDEYEVVS